MNQDKYSDRLLEHYEMEAQSGVYVKWYESMSNKFQPDWNGWK